MMKSGNFTTKKMNKLKRYLTEVKESLIDFYRFDIEDLPGKKLLMGTLLLVLAGMFLATVRNALIYFSPEQCSEYINYIDVLEVVGILLLVLTAVVIGFAVLMGVIIMIGTLFEVFETPSKVVKKAYNAATAVKSKVGFSLPKPKFIAVVNNWFQRNEFALSVFSIIFVLIVVISVLAIEIYKFYNCIGY